MNITDFSRTNPLTKACKAKKNKLIRVEKNVLGKIETYPTNIHKELSQSLQ
jgi:hypothetical protein